MTLLCIAQVFDNVMKECRAFGVKVQSSPQGIICGNTIVVPTGVDPDVVSCAGSDQSDVLCHSLRVSPKLAPHLTSI